MVSPNRANSFIMKIAIYSAKGSAGKTPLAVELALERGWHVATNEDYSMLDKVIPEDFLIEVNAGEEFPVFHDDADIIFDLGGFISNAAASITSAVSQADVVLVPIYNETKSIYRGIATILEVQAINPNIVIVATKLQKQKGEVFKDWADSMEFKGIKEIVEAQVGINYPMFPLKYSKAYDAIFDLEASLESIRRQDPLSRYTYREVSEQLQALKNHLDQHYGN